MQAGARKRLACSRVAPPPPDHRLKGAVSPRTHRVIRGKGALGGGIDLPSPILN